MEVQTGRKGNYIKREETINDVERILKGEFDAFPPEKLRNVGKLDELKS